MSWVTWLVAIGLFILLVLGLMYAPGRTIGLVKKVAVKSFELVSTILKEGKPIVEDITEGLNKNESDGSG